MIKLEIEISDVDYDTLLENYLPKMTYSLRASGNPIAMLLSNGMSASFAKTIVSKLTQEQKDGLVADIIKSNSAEIKSGILTAAAQKQIYFEINRIDAKTKDKN